MAVHVPKGHYRLEAKPLDSLVSGRWYLGWRCSSCAKEIAVLDDPSQGKGGVPLLGEGVVHFNCPLCKEGNGQSCEAMVHFRAP